jgi:hypothetical protein
MNPIILAKGVETTVAQTATDVAATLVDPNPITELTLATVVLVFIITIHGWLLGQASKFFSSEFALFSTHTARWRVSLLTGATIALLVIIHLIETLLWTIPLLQFGIMDNFRDAYYYVLEAYTTLGEGNITLPDEWRLVGPVIAISGLFTFGWTASVLVSVMNEVAKLHAERSRAAAKGAAGTNGETKAPPPKS